jgi:hypothetical protein
MGEVNEEIRLEPVTEAVVGPIRAPAHESGPKERKIILITIKCLL